MRSLSAKRMQHRPTTEEAGTRYTSGTILYALKTNKKEEKIPYSPRL